MGKRVKRKQPFRDKPAKRACPVEKAGIMEVDYKDIELLKNFLTTNGKIIPRRISGLSARTQTRITEAIKRSRNAGLLSFAEGYISQEDEKPPYERNQRGPRPERTPRPAPASTEGA